MRYTSSQDPSLDPGPRHSLETTVGGTVMTTLLMPLLVLVVSYPVAAAAGVGLLLASWPLVKRFRQVYRARKRQGRTRRVCAPKTGICVDV